jgi:hypothetical protein
MLGNRHPAFHADPDSLNGLVAFPTEQIQNKSHIAPSDVPRGDLQFV